MVGHSHRSSIRPAPGAGHAALPARIVRSAALFGILLAFAAGAARGTGVSRIAYSRWVGTANPMITLIDPDGSNQTPVTSDYYGGDGAAISPNGAWIAFENPSLGTAHLYIIGSDGTGQRRLTSGYGQSATWSPDNSKIIYVGAGGSVYNLWSINFNGTSAKRLTTTAAGDWGPDWSRDGGKVAFYSKRDSWYQIYTLNPDGTGQQKITTSPGHKFSPRWSPDGARIVYSMWYTFGMHSPSSLHVMNADGTSDVMVADTTSSNGRPAWSPDGTRIAFQSDRTGYYEIYTMTTDGSDVQQVTFDATSDGGNNWNGSWGLVTSPAGVDEEAPVATATRLALHVPNPVHGAAAISVEIDRAGPVTLEIFDSSGRRIRALLAGTLAPGTHVATWDGLDERGAPVAGGVYHCRLACGGERRTAKVVYVK